MLLVMTTKIASPPNATMNQVLTHVRYEHLVAGITGGVIATLLLHPLDLVKVRLAVDDGRTLDGPRYSGPRGTAAYILREEGLRGLYRGLVPNVWGNGSAWGFYFLFYNTAKTWIQGGNTKKALGPGTHMLAAAGSGVLTLTMTNPIWVVKTRLCLQYGPNAHLNTYSGMLDALTKIYRTEGIRGLYKGFAPGLFGVSHGAIQFMTYEELKNGYNQYRRAPIDTKLATHEYLAFAAASKLVSVALTYPYQVVRARLQDRRREYAGVWDCARRTARFEGISGFYKGLSVNLTRVVPATMITFLVYEKCSRFLIGLRKDDV